MLLKPSFISEKWHMEMVLMLKKRSHNIDFIDSQ